MQSKTEILHRLRSRPMEDAPLPGVDVELWKAYDDPMEQFSQTLSAVGGRAVVVESEDQIPSRLAEMEAFTTAKQICSLASDILPGTIDLNAVNDPHELQHIDFCLARAKFGVAENAAAWVADAGVRHRVIFFITQHMAMVLSANQIVHNMGQAYEKLTFQNAGFGVFISGPSKTADIEQSLVIGAHGPRSLTVFLVQA